MDELGLRNYLKKQRRSESAIDRVVSFSKRFAVFLDMTEKSLDDAEPSDLEGFIASDQFEKKQTKTFLWGVRYYYEFTGNSVMKQAAATLRAGKITRKPLLLSEFRGVDEKVVERLAKTGVKDVAQMRNMGKTAEMREGLASRSGLPVDVILEIVKLSDLARIPGVKGIRARLYYEAGFDTLDKIAACQPGEFRGAIEAYTKAVEFDGIPPWPKEAQGAVSSARQLKKWVEYD